MSVRTLGALASLLNLIVLLQPACGQALQAGAAWPMFGGDTYHSGRSLFSGPNGTVVRSRWNFTTGGNILSHPAVGADGTIYVGSNDHHLYAINSSSGSQIWAAATGFFVKGGAAIGSYGMLYFGSSDNNVYAVNSTGTQLWNFTTGGPVRSSPAIGPNGRLFVGSDDTYLYALSNATGIPVWSFNTGGVIYASPAIGANGFVYVGSVDGCVYAVRSSVGSQSWKFTTNGNIFASPSIGSDGTVYVGSYDNNLYALNGTTGTPIWNFTTGNNIHATAAIGADGTIYVGSFDARVYAINGSTGALRWTFQTGGSVRTAAAISSDGTLYVTSEDGYVYGLDGSTGVQKWNYSIGGHLYSNPVLGADGTLYVGSVNFSCVFAIENVPSLPAPSVTPSSSPSATASPSIQPSSAPKSGLQAGAAWPIRGGNIQRTGRTSIKGPQGPIVTAKWRVNLGCYVQDSATIDWNGAVYVGCDDMNVYALDGNSGAIKWSYMTSSIVSTSPTIGADGTVYIGSWDGAVYAFNSMDGVPKWVVPTSGSIVSSVSVGSDGTVYVGANQFDLYAINGTTGVVLWTAATGNFIPSSPSITQDGIVIIGSLDWKVYAFNASTGAEKWQFHTGGGVSSSPAIDSNGTVYIGCLDHYVYALNASTGEMKWRYLTGDGVCSTPAIGLDGTIYVGSYDGYMYALNGKSGALVWQFYTMDLVYSSPLLGADGTVYFGSADSYIYALNGTTGQLRWSYFVHDQVQASLAINANGTLFFGSADHFYSAIHDAAPTPLPSASPAASSTPKSSPYPVGESIWPMRGGGVQHTGRSALLGPQGPTVVQKWRYDAGASIGSSPAIGRDGTIYFGGVGGSMYALDSRDGQVVWVDTFSDAISSSPTIGTDGTIYVGTWEHTVVALDPATGSVIWNFATGDTVQSSPTLTPDGSLIVGCDDSRLYVLDSATGLEKWHIQLSSSVYSSAAIAPDGSIVVGCLDGSLYSIDPDTHLQKWRFIIESFAIFSSPAIGLDGSVYVGGFDGNVYAINGTTGNATWHYATGLWILGSAAIGADNTVYIGSSDFYLYAFNGMTGAVKWSFQTGYWVQSTPLIGPDNTIYFGSHDGRMYAVNGSTGAFKWSFDTEGAEVVVAPAIGTDGTLYFGGFDNFFYAVADPPPSPTPTTSATVIASPSVSFSMLPSVTSSASWTPAGNSGVGTKTPTGTSTYVAYVTYSGTPPPTASSSGSWSSHPSISSSSSVRPSLVPGEVSLELRADSAGLRKSNDGTILLSDGQPMVHLPLEASNCASGCIVNCSVEDGSIGSASPSVLSLSGAMSSASLAAWAPFAACPFTSAATTLTCRSGPAIAWLSVSCERSRWPLFSDAIVFMANGLARSAWSPPFNVSGMSSSEEVGASVPQPTDATLAFNMIVNEGARILLKAEPSMNFTRAFSDMTQVLANNVTCNVSWVSADGSLMEIILPLHEDLCPDVLFGEDCGYVQLSIIAHSDADATGRTLSCPPFCPHDFPGTVPMGIDTESGVQIVPGLTGNPPTALSLTSLPSTGFYLTEACTASGFLDPALGLCLNSSDPRYAQCAFGAGSQCRSCPPGALCPGGYRAWPLPGYYTGIESTGDISACPAPALQRCTGWNASVAEVQCGNGYKQSFMCAACATNYYPALDGVCKPCPVATNPVVDIILPMAIFFGGLVAACVTIYCALLLVARVRGASTADLPKRMAQLGAWVFMTVQVVSQVGQAAGPGLPPIVLSVYNQLAIFQFHGAALPSACVPGFPFLDEVLSMSFVLFVLCCAATIAILLAGPGDNLGAPIVLADPTPILVSLPAPATPSRSPFTTSGKLNISDSQQTIRRRQLLGSLFRVCVLGLAVLYATVTNSVISVLHCTTVNVSGSAYAALIGVLPSLTRARTSAAVSVSLLQSNPSIVCYTGSHVSVAALAWVTLLLYCIAYPLVTVWLVTRRMTRMQARSDHNPKDGNDEQVVGMNTDIGRIVIPGTTESETKTTPGIVNPLHYVRVLVAAPKMRRTSIGPMAADPLLAPFVAADYYARVFWFFLVDRAYFVVLACVQEFLDSPISRFSITIATLVCMAALLALIRPFVAGWKLVVKLYAVLLCLLAAVLNLVVAESPEGEDVPGMVPLAYIVVVASVGLFIALLLAFVYDVLAGMPSKEPVPLQQPHPQKQQHGESVDNESGGFHENPLHVSAQPAARQVITAEAPSPDVHRGSTARSVNISRRLSARWATRNVENDEGNKALRPVLSRSPYARGSAKLHS
jgi:outer membrane protein assembly factor BamB